MKRILVGIFAPAPLGTTLFVIVSNALDPRHLDSEAFWALPLGIIGGSFYAYVLIGPQSVIYSLLMEHFVNRLLRSDAASIRFSAVLGALSGTGTALLFPRADIWPVLVFTVIGTIVGFAVGYWLRRMYRAAAARGVVSE